MELALTMIVGILAACLAYHIGASRNDGLVAELRYQIERADQREKADRKSREDERTDFRRIMSDIATAQGIAIAGVAPGRMVPDGIPPPTLGTGLDAKNRPVPSIVGMLPREDGSFNLTEPPQRSEFDGDLDNFDMSRHAADPRFLNGRTP